MAHFDVHIMTFDDASARTIHLPYPVFGLSEEVHRAVFLESPIEFEQYPQLRKLRMECWAILEKYFENDLVVLVQECQDIATKYQADEHISSIFSRFGEVCLRAVNDGMGIVCTGD